MEWEEVYKRVTDLMNEHTRPFISPLSKETNATVRHVGSGTYVAFDAGQAVITCQHVSREAPLNAGVFGSTDVLAIKHPFTESTAKDIAYARIDDAFWKATKHSAKSVPFARFAVRHDPRDRSELLFFRGFAGENSPYGFGVLDGLASGYLTQQQPTDDPEIFELPWEPAKTQLTGIPPRPDFRKDDPGGFSGALVWNTRFMECAAAKIEWSPDLALVTGLIRRWDTKTKTLLALKIEHVNHWMGSKVRP